VTASLARWRELFERMDLDDLVAVQRLLNRIVVKRRVAAAGRWLKARARVGERP
jgi:hypothetical protein